MPTQVPRSRSRALVVLAATLALGLPATGRAASFDAPASYPVGGIRPS